MASYSHGYYGLSGSSASKTADFGLAANMTLPILTPIPDLDAEVAADPGSVTMPNEHKSKKKARFSADTLDRMEKRQLAQTNGYEEEVVLRAKKPSWRSRLSGVFRRNSKRGDGAEEAAQVQEASVKPAIAKSDFPTKTVDDFEVDSMKAEARRKKRKKRSTKSRSTAFDESPFPLGEESSSPDLLKLALRPKNASSDFKDIRVTLRRKADGFGIHLSGGLPPITVTYVQPGSEAESARIVVGDMVTEVNGHDCRKGVGISRIMELKTLIQQASFEQEDTTDGVWEKIKEKQEELDSEDGEITRIDDTTESEEEQPRKIATPPPRIETPKQKASREKPQKMRQPKMELSEFETPKRKSHRMTETEQKSSRKSPQVDYSEAADMNPKSSTPKKGTKKKKKRSDLDTTESPVTTPPTSPIKPSEKDSSLVTVGVIKKPKRKKTNEARRAEENEHSRQPLNKSSFMDTTANTSATEGAKKQRKKKKSIETETPSAGMDIMMTPSDLIAEPSTLEPKSRDPDDKKSSKGKSKKKTKSVDTTQEEPAETKKRLKHSVSDSKTKTKAAVEESDDLEWVDYGNVAPTNKYNRRKSVDIAQQDAGFLEISSQKRSTSYHALDKEERRMFKEELKQASKSEYDIKGKADAGPKVDIDPDVKVKKSGKVVAKRTKRPTILETDGAEVETEPREDTLPKKKGKRRKRSNQDMDISAVPQTNPSLGLKHGHEKLDVISRSVSKRRPASKRKTLLLDSKKEVLMGNERVDLSDPGDGKLLRQASLDKQPDTTAEQESHTPELEKPKTPELESKTPEPKKPLSATAAPRTNPVVRSEAPADIDQPMARSRRQSIVEYMESLQKAKYNSLSRPASSLQSTEEEVSAPTQPQSIPQDSVTKRIVNNQEKVNLQSLARLANNSQKMKAEAQPVKKPGGAGETEKKESVPSWVSIAQSKRNRGSVLYDGGSSKPVSEPSASTPPPTVTVDPLLGKKHSDNSVPRMGTVMDRLAMFQRK